MVQKNGDVSDVDELRAARRALNCAKHEHLDYAKHRGNVHRTAEPGEEQSDALRELPTMMPTSPALAVPSPHLVPMPYTMPPVSNYASDDTQETFSTAVRGMAERMDAGTLREESGTASTYTHITSKQEEGPYPAWQRALAEQAEAHRDLLAMESRQRALLNDEACILHTSSVVDTELAPATEWVRRVYSGGRRQQHDERAREWTQRAGELSRMRHSATPRVDSRWQDVPAPAILQSRLKGDDCLANERLLEMTAALKQRAALTRHAADRIRSDIGMVPRFGHAALDVMVVDERVDEPTCHMACEVQPQHQSVLHEYVSMPLSPEARREASMHSSGRAQHSDRQSGAAELTRLGVPHKVRSRPRKIWVVDKSSPGHQHEADQLSAVGAGGAGGHANALGGRRAERVAAFSVAATQLRATASRAASMPASPMSSPMAWGAMASPQAAPPVSPELSPDRAMEWVELGRDEGSVQKSVRRSPSREALSEAPHHREPSRPRHVRSHAHLNSHLHRQETLAWGGDMWSSSMAEDGSDLGSEHYSWLEAEEVPKGARQEQPAFLPGPSAMAYHQNVMMRWSMAEGEAPAEGQTRREGASAMTWAERDALVGELPSGAEAIAAAVAPLDSLASALESPKTPPAPSGEERLEGDPAEMPWHLYDFEPAADRRATGQLSGLPRDLAMAPLRSSQLVKASSRALSRELEAASRKAVVAAESSRASKADSRALSRTSALESVFWTFEASRSRLQAEAERLEAEARAVELVYEEARQVVSVYRQRVVSEGVAPALRSAGRRGDRYAYAYPFEMAMAASSTISPASASPPKVTRTLGEGSISHDLPRSPIISRELSEVSSAWSDTSETGRADPDGLQAELSRLQEQINSMCAELA